MQSLEWLVPRKLFISKRSQEFYECLCPQSKYCIYAIIVNSNLDHQITLLFNDSPLLLSAWLIEYNFGRVRRLLELSCQAILNDFIVSIFPDYWSSRQINHINVNQQYPTASPRNLVFTTSHHVNLKIDTIHSRPNICLTHSPSRTNFLHNLAQTNIFTQTRPISHSPAATNPPRSPWASTIPPHEMAAKYRIRTHVTLKTRTIGANYQSATNETNIRQRSSWETYDH